MSQRSHIVALSLLLTTSILGGSFAHAQTVLEQVAARMNADAREAARIVGSSSAIAGSYRIDLEHGQKVGRKKTGVALESAVTGNFVFGDLNGDGHRDLAVITEDAPSVVAGQAQFGARHLQIYLSDGTNSFHLVTENSKVVLRADQGGNVGDPLNGLELNRSNRMIILSQLGETKTQWERQHYFRFKGESVVFVGTSVVEYDLNARGEQTGLGRSVTTNFALGEKKTKSFESEDVESATVVTQLQKQFIPFEKATFKEAAVKKAVAKSSDSSVTLKPATAADEKAAITLKPAGTSVTPARASSTTSEKKK